MLGFDGDADFGLYQIYAEHPVYGADALVYIGKARDETFARRLRQPEYKWMNDDYAPWEDNASRIRFRTGRVHVTRRDSAPGPAKWNAWIDRAERLLIYAHSPARNCDFVRTPPSEPPFHDLHVLNWGQYGSLLPEVSGARFLADPVWNKLNDDPVGT